MDNLLYSLNATVPVFAIIVAGYLLKKIGWINDAFISVANQLNFKLTLPLLLIQDLMAMDFRAAFDPEYIAFCVVATSVCFFSTWFLARKFLKDRSVTGEFVQGAFRGSAAVLGTAFMRNIYGSAGMVPMMILGAVPLYNIFSVIVLETESPAAEGGEAGISREELKRVRRGKLKKSVKGIVTNPIIISIAIGLILSLLNVDLPEMADLTLSNLTALSTPLALLAIGGAFKFGDVVSKIRPTMWGAFIKLIGQPLIFLPVAVMLGFTGPKLMALVIMLGAPTTPSCYVMAKGAGCDGTLTTGLVVLTTCLSAFTVTGIIFILKSLGLV